MNTRLPSSELVIRPASFNDISFIQSIAQQTWSVAYASILSHEQLEYMLHKFYSIPSLEEQMKAHHYFFLALKEYVPAGFASFSKIHGSTYKLQKLYVLPGEQKSGLGQKLLETVETIAESMGATLLQLNVNRNNKAQRFYERNSFTVIEEEDIDIGNGYFMNDYVMEKKLDKPATDYV